MKTEDWEDLNMENLTVVGWTYFDAPYKTKKLNREEVGIIISLIEDEIAKHHYVFSGEEHQNALTGMPVFSDGTCFRASMRSWGGLMASMYRGADGEELSYMDFYMSLGDASNLPEYVPIDVPPAEVEDESVGAIVKADREMVEQAIALDMEFMTTDKVLEKLFKKLKQEK